MVFQKPNPFPKSIYDNVAYGPRINGIRNRARLDEIVERSLRQGALWDEVKDRLGKAALAKDRSTGSPAPPTTAPRPASPAASADQGPARPLIPPPVICSSPARVSCVRLHVTWAAYEVQKHPGSNRPQPLWGRAMGGADLHASWLGTTHGSHRVCGWWPQPTGIAVITASTRQPR
jgi:hypothetical protein